MDFYLLAVGNPPPRGAILNRTEPATEAGSLVRVAHLVGRVRPRWSGDAMSPATT
jgi:hypothetical protein